MSAETRIRLALTRDSEPADLIAAIRQDAEVGVPPTVVKGDRRYARYPGFGRLSDAAFDVTTAPDWPVKLDATAMSWSGDVLTVTARAASPVALSVSAEEIPADVQVDGGRVRIRLRASELLSGDPGGRRRAVSAQPGGFDPARAVGAGSATGAAGAAALRAPHVRTPKPVVRRRGTRLYVIAPTVDESGRLMISVVPLTPKRVAAQLRKRCG